MHVINLIETEKIKAERIAPETEKVQPTDTSLSVLLPYSGQDCVRTCHYGVIDLTIIFINHHVNMKLKKNMGVWIVNGAAIIMGPGNIISFPSWPILSCFLPFKGQI